MSKLFRSQFFLDIFVSSRLQVFLSDGSEQQSCPNVFTKQSTKKTKPFFFSICFITFLSVSRSGEFKNTIKTPLKQNLTLVLFCLLASDPPTHHGGHRFVFVSPLHVKPYTISISCKGHLREDGKKRRTYYSFEIF
jgi:hypothetical protein